MTRLSEWWRQLMPMTVDLVITVVVLIEIQLEAWLDSGIPTAQRPMTSVAAVIFVVPLVYRRALPNVAFVVCAATALLQAPLHGDLMQDMTGTLLPPIILAYSLGRYSTTRRGAIVLVVAEGLLVAAILASTLSRSTVVDSLIPNVLGECVLTVGPWALGSLLERRARSIAQLQRLEAQVASQQGQRELQAAITERRRIAGELEDVIAQQISALAVQAAGAKQFVRRDRHRAGLALQAIEAGGHEALDDLRHAVRLLRDGDEANVRTHVSGTVRSLFDGELGSR